MSDDDNDMSFDAIRKKVEAAHDPRAFAVARRLTEEIFGNPNEPSVPVQQTPIPNWDPEQKKIAGGTTVGSRDYFSYAKQTIAWSIIPQIQLNGVQLFDAKEAEKNLLDRMELFANNFQLRGPDRSTLIGSMFGTNTKGQGHNDPVWGNYQGRTYTVPNVDYKKRVGLKGSELISIWTQFGVNVLGTWFDQTDSDPRQGLPMSQSGILLEREYRNWQPGPWEWHKNEYIVPDKMYPLFKFSGINIRLLFHLIEKYKMVFTNPPPQRKRN